MRIFAPAGVASLHGGGGRLNHLGRRVEDLRRVFLHLGAGDGIDLRAALFRRGLEVLDR